MRLGQGDDELERKIVQMDLRYLIDKGMRRNRCAIDD